MTFTKEKAGKTHNLKIWPEYFAAVRDGLKRAELRCNDRDYQADDTLELCEWDPNEEAFTGEYISVTVTHVADIGQWMPGYVLLSIAAPQHLTTSERAELENYRSAQQEVPEEMDLLTCHLDGVTETYAEGWNACRAAMLQGAENVESRCTMQTAPALDSSQIIAESPSGNSPVIPDCSCGTCRPVTFTDSRFVVCSECGNKRCPHANDHRNACTGSNEPGQEGSAYPAAPQQEVK